VILRRVAEPRPAIQIETSQEADFRHADQ